MKAFRALSSNTLDSKYKSLYGKIYSKVIFTLGTITKVLVASYFKWHIHFSFFNVSNRCFVHCRLLACTSECVFSWWLLSVTFGVGEGGWLSIISFNYLKHTKRPKLTSLPWLLKKPCIFHDWETNRMSLSPSPLLWQDKTYHCYLSLLCAPSLQETCCQCAKQKCE